MSRRKWTGGEKAALVFMAMLVVAGAVCLGFFLAAVTDNLLHWATAT